jgi:transposase-like protein
MSLARLAAEAASAPTPSAALSKLSALRQELEEFERAQVARALQEGASFASIGRDLGLSRQAVHRRYRELAPAIHEPPVMLPSPEVRLALRYAREEAAAVGASALGGEHVLLGLLRAVTLRPLDDAGVTLTKVRAQVAATSTRSRAFGHAGHVALDLRTLLAGPTVQALRRGSRTIGAEDLLLGILRAPGSRAPRTLRAIGADPDAICDQLDALAERWHA